MNTEQASKNIFMYMNVFINDIFICLTTWDTYIATLMIILHMLSKDFHQAQKCLKKDLFSDW